MDHVAPIEEAHGAGEAKGRVMATVTISGTDYPSYSSVADADLYLAADAMRAVAWAARSTDEKGRGLVTATRLLQGLTWCSGTSPDIDTPGATVEAVTAQYAADILSDPELVTATGAPGEIKRAKAGSVEVEFFKNFDGTVSPVPTSLWNQLKAAGLVGCSSDDGLAGGEYSGARTWSHFDPRCSRYPYAPEEMEYPDECC